MAVAVVGSNGAAVVGSNRADGTQNCHREADECESSDSSLPQAHGAWLQFSHLTESTFVLCGTFVYIDE
jgi:hypothetical protein